MGSNAAPCSKDRLALSGGVDVVSDGAVPPTTAIQASIGTGDNEALVEWTASVVNPSANKIDIAINAICAAKPEGYVVTTDSNTTVDPGSSNETTLTCLEDLVVLGGGGGIRSDTVVDTQTFLEESRPVETASGQWNGWRVRARNNADTARPLTAQIICAKKPDGYEVRSQPRNVPAAADHRINERVACSTGSVALSGGAGITDQIARDGGTQTVLRESTPIAAPDGSDVEQWLTHMSVKAAVERSVTAYAICADLPR